MSAAFDTIVAALEGAGMQTHRTAEGCRSQCPVHGSRGLTLSVRAGDGRALLHCFAGCQDEQVLDAIGLSVRDLFDSDRPREYVPPKQPPSAWDEAMQGLGLRRYPPLEHLLHRMTVEHAKARDGIGPLCTACGTPTSPWSCSCGQTRVGADYWDRERAAAGLPPIGGAA